MDPEQLFFGLNVDALHITVLLRTKALPELGRHLRLSAPMTKASSEVRPKVTDELRRAGPHRSKCYVGNPVIPNTSTKIRQTLSYLGQIGGFFCLFPVGGHHRTVFSLIFFCYSTKYPLNSSLTFGKYSCPYSGSSISCFFALILL